MKALKALYLTAIIMAVAFAGCGGSTNDPTEPTPDRGVLSITSNVDGAAIYLNGEFTGYNTPSDLELPAEQTYRIEVVKTGRIPQPDYLEVYLFADGYREVEFHLVDPTNPCESCRADQICSDNQCVTPPPPDPCEFYRPIELVELWESDWRDQRVHFLVEGRGNECYIYDEGRYLTPGIPFNEDYRYIPPDQIRFRVDMGDEIWTPVQN